MTEGRVLSQVGDYCECCDPDVTWCANKPGRTPSAVVHKRVEVADGYVLPCDRGQRLASFEWTDQWDEVTCPDCLTTPANTSGKEEGR